MERTESNKLYKCVRGVIPIASLAMLAMPEMAFAEESCGDGGGGSMDIASLTASFDDTTKDITVEMALCAAADPMTKYRVHFDHTAPFADDADRNGDIIIDINDVCYTTSDDGMMRKGNKHTGPGFIDDSDKSNLIYTVNMSELSSNLEVGDTILVWADTQHNGIIDRAPDTIGEDGCSKPETLDEVIELKLAPPFRHVFVTDATTTGKMGMEPGLAAADAICNAEANAEGSLANPGDYVAWLSDNMTDAKNRIPDAQYRRVDGALVALSNADLIDGIIHNPIAHTTTAPLPGDALVWTGTDYAGSKAAPPDPHGGSCTECHATAPDSAYYVTCGAWTQEEGGTTGVTGQSGQADLTWTLGTLSTCATVGRLYCFQVPAQDE